MCGAGYIGFFFQAEGGIRDLVRSRGLGDEYKRQAAHGHGRLDVDGRGPRLINDAVAGRPRPGAEIGLSLIHI